MQLKTKTTCDAPHPAQVFIYLH